MNDFFINELTSRGTKKNKNKQFKFLLLVIDRIDCNANFVFFLASIQKYIDTLDSRHISCNVKRLHKIDYDRIFVTNRATEKYLNETREKTRENETERDKNGR